VLLFYLQQRNGERSFKAVPNAPLQALPLSVAAKLGLFQAPAKTGQSPPQVKQTLQATAVWLFAAAGLSAGIGFDNVTPTSAVPGAAD